jgi:hypothetical protein
MLQISISTVIKNQAKMAVNSVSQIISGKSQNGYLKEVHISSYGSIKFSISKTKLHGLSPEANYTDRATAACRRSDCQLLRIEGATWSA